MKTVILLFFLHLTYGGSFATDSTGVYFLTGTWQETLTEARRLNKPIFVDVYTTWCGPCKLMAKEAFPNAQIGALFNDNFINYKIDAERGEGVLLAKQFVVTVYPTLLFVNADNEVICRTTGYGGVDDLLQEANKVINVTKELKQLTDKTKPSKEDLQNPVYVKEYLKALAKLRRPVGKLLDEYLNRLSQDKLVIPENLSIMAGTVSSSNSKAFDVLLEQLPVIKTLPVGQEALITMPIAIANDFRKAVESNNELALEKLIVKNGQLLTRGGLTAPELVEQESLDKKIDFYRQIKKYEKYHQLAGFYAQTQLMSQNIDSLRTQDQTIYKRFQRGVVASDSLRKTNYFAKMNEAMKHRASYAVADKLNELAQSYYENITNPNHLKEALTWSRRASDLCQAPTHLETYAHLLYRLNKKDEAIKYQQQAINRAKETGDSAQELEVKLKRMKTGTL